MVVANFRVTGLKFSKALSHKRRQPLKVIFWNWGPTTIWHNLASAQFFSSKITPPYFRVQYILIDLFLGYAPNIQFLKSSKYMQNTGYVHYTVDPPPIHLFKNLRVYILVQYVQLDIQYCSSALGRRVGVGEFGGGWEGEGGDHTHYKEGELLIHKL